MRERSTGLLITKAVLDAISRRSQSVVIAIVIMVVVIPIVVRMPTMVVFIPPFMFCGPAVFPGLVQLVAPMFRLLTVIAVVLDGFVQIVVGFRDASLAVVGPQAGSACKYEKSCQCCYSKSGSSEERIV